MKKRIKKERNMKKMGYLLKFFQKYTEKTFNSLVPNHCPTGNKIPSKIRPSQYNKTTSNCNFEQ